MSALRSGRRGFASESRAIRYGDRVYVSVSIRGRIVVEFETSTVGDYSELMRELRSRTRGVSGLTQLRVRNMSRGWSLERPFKLYSELMPRAAAAGMRAAAKRNPESSRFSGVRREIPESIRLLYGSH